MKRFERRYGRLVLPQMLFLVTAVNGQEPPLSWNATQNFAYRVDSASATQAGGSWNVKVIFSVANPAPSTAFPDPFWNIKSALPFTGGTLRILIGWDAAEFMNTNSRGSLNPVATGPSSVGAALPVSINAISASQPCTPANCAELGSLPPAGHFTVNTTVSPLAFPSGQVVTSGVVAMEGRPVCPTSGPALPGCPVSNGTPAAIIPVKSAVRAFALNGGPPAGRRKIVDIALCKGCHDGGKHGDTIVPRLSLHGGNRNEELGLCVICHNANQTDIPFRTSGEEVSIDFKRMIHGIHAGGFRKTPLRIVGFQGALQDFGGVRFPAELRNCLKCHIEENGKGSFELPINTKALGSTVQTGSTQSSATAARTIDTDPWNDLKITPTAAACSGCHDSSEVRGHMIRTGGASFGTRQDNIIAGVTERCVNCHGPGKPEDVRRAHEIRTSRSPRGGERVGRD